MNRLVDFSTWPGRFFLLTSIVVLPFLRFLLQNRYNPLSLESLVAAANLAATCAVLALIARTRLFFAAIALGSIILVATLPAVRLVHPLARISPVAASALLVAALVPLHLSPARNGQNN